MHINTKVVFEWDQDKQEYLEVYSEGYEYSGDLELAMPRFAERGPGRPPPKEIFPTGYQGYQSLWDLSQGGGMAGYLESEFDIGTGYEQYIRPFEDKPFEFLETGLGLEQEALETTMGVARSTTTTGLGEARGAVGTAYAQSNLANVGGITQGFEQQKDKLMEAFKQSQVAYGLGMEESQLGYEADVYGEQKAQEERFYDDITAIIHMQQS